MEMGAKLLNCITEEKKRSLNASVLMGQHPETERERRRRLVKLPGCKEQPALPLCFAARLLR